MRNLRLVQENFGSINDIQLKESEIPSPKNNETWNGLLRKNIIYFW